MGLTFIPGSRVIDQWGDQENQPKIALRAGKVDVLTLSPIWMPDEGIEKFARLGVEHNPKIRVAVQEFWMPNDTYEPKYPLDMRQEGGPQRHRAGGVAQKSRPSTITTSVTSSAA